MPAPVRVALEILDSWPEVETIVVPIGGGGLASGIARVARSASPAIHVVGVEVAQSCPFTAARTAGRIVPITVGQTLADGLSGNVDPDTLTWDYIRDLVDEIVTVSEDKLAEGLRCLVAEDHLIAEGAGVAAVAAVAARAALDGSRTAVVVSGANIDNWKLLKILTMCGNLSISKSAKFVICNLQSAIVNSTEPRSPASFPGWTRGTNLDTARQAARGMVKSDRR